MSSSVCTSARFSRQVVVASGVVMLLVGASVAQAQTAPVVKATAVVEDHQPGQDPKPAEDPRFVGSGQQMMILVLVKPDKTADFEAVMAKLKEAIATPDKADDPAATPDAAKAAADLKARKAQWRKQAEGWSVWKVAEPMGGNVTYIWNLSPVVEGASYNPTPIIYDNFPRADADVLYGKLAGALANLIKWTTTKVTDIK